MGVGAADLERGLDRVRAEAAGPAEGVFGPASVLWRVDREAAVFLGAGRALLLQLAHPWVAAAVAEHSAALADPIGRFHRTFSTVFALVFGSLDRALDTSRRLHRRHSAVSGAMPERLGPFREGSPYRANEVSALLWVHATLVDTALRSYELALPPLSREERERYYADCRRLGALFGLSSDEQPPDWPAFLRYMENTLASQQLTVGEAARTVGSGVLAGAGRIPVPRWYRDVTASLMPERFRAPFGLAFGQAEQRRAARALGVVRRLYPAMPARVRTVPSYQEALGRIAGRSRPDRLTRSLSRLWIGRPSLDG